MPTLFDIVALYADDSFPDKLAIITEEDGSRTYRELADRAGRLAYALHDPLGLPVGDRVSVWMQQRPEWIETASPALGGRPVGGGRQSAVDRQRVRLRARPTPARRPSSVTRTASSGHCSCSDEVGCLEHVITLGEPGLGRVGLRVAAGRRPERRRRAAARAARDGRGCLELHLGDDDRPAQGGGVPAGRSRGRRRLRLHGDVRPERPGPGHHHHAVLPRERPVGRQPGPGRGGQLRLPAPVLGPSVLGPGGPVPADVHDHAGALVNILMSLAPSDLERSHSFRVLVVLGSGPNMAAMEERYGTPVIDWYGMTEAGMGTYTRLDEDRRPGRRADRSPGRTCGSFETTAPRPIPVRRGKWSSTPRSPGSPAT